VCKLEEYGNCDEETREQEYCIFHKPDKNEIEAREFYKKFLERFRHRSEKVKIEESLGEKVIIRFVFEKDVNCAGYHFPKIPKDSNFSFEYAVFKGNAWFGGVTFKGNASFKGTVFEKYAEFDEATFEKMLILVGQYLIIGRGLGVLHLKGVQTFGNRYLNIEHCFLRLRLRKM